MMHYTSLGRTGLQVSRVCLGTMNFGPLADERASFAMMDRALEYGINLFDTANGYGGQPGAGLTEQIIGRWFAQGEGRRSRVVLGTKLYALMADWPNGSGINALTIRRECEASLRRLQTDYIDLYQMHHIPRGTPWEEIWQAMEQLVREGKVLYVGSSNFAGWHIAQANERARERHFMGLVSEQSVYNLTARMVELEVLPACEAYGVGLIPYSPLGGGALSGGLEQARDGRRTTARVVQRIQEQGPRLEQYQVLCAELGETPSSVALAWLLHNPLVTAPIIGPRTMDQLDQLVCRLDLRLSSDTLDRLEGIFPGPGKGKGLPAPEAYAW
jgi:aryl-alcohol dehydrogenase-like predicted oxidoreductase